MARDRRPIDPALRRFLDAQAAAAGPAPAMTDRQRARERRAAMLRALEGRTSIAGLPNAVETRDVAFSDALSARLYTPGQAAEPHPVLVYLHGGGWVAGSVATHDPFCRLLSQAAGVMVVSVEYRRAPEHAFPAALDDTLAAVRWAQEQAGSWGGDPTRLGLGGDSSGANLAAVAGNRLCATPVSATPVSATQGAPALRALLLLYPVIDHPSAGHASYAENATGYGLEASLMRWYWEQYAPGAAAEDANLSPLRVRDVPALPPTLIATAEYDVLRDEGIAYVERLREAGVAVTHLHAPDMHHNFSVHPATVALFPQSQATLSAAAEWLRSTLAPRRP